MGRVPNMEEMRNAYEILDKEPEGKRPFARRKFRWRNNIEMDHKEIRWKTADWIHLAHNRVQWWSKGVHNKLLGPVQRKESVH